MICYNIYYNHLFSAFNRSAKSRGTYRVTKSRLPVVKLSGVTTSETDDMNATTNSQTDDEKLLNLSGSSDKLKLLHRGEYVFFLFLKSTIFYTG